MNSSLSSNICDQNVNFFTKISCRSEMKATRSPGETAKYVIKAKLVSSLRDTILANFGLFRRQKNGFWFVYNKFLLPFHNKHILSCKKMQKKFSLHIHFKLRWQLRWSHIHFICVPAVHIISFCVSFLSRVENSINWPASSVWVFKAQLVEHCSANAEATGSNPVEAPKNFFSDYFAIA